MRIRYETVQNISGRVKKAVIIDDASAPNSRNSGSIPSSVTKMVGNRAIQQFHFLIFTKCRQRAFITSKIATLRKNRIGPSVVKTGKCIKNATEITIFDPIENGNSGHSL